MLKTSTRQTVFLPVAGLVEPESLKPGDLVGVNKDSYLILDTLPAEYDSRWVARRRSVERGLPACLPARPPAVCHCLLVCLPECPVDTNLAAPPPACLPCFC